MPAARPSVCARPAARGPLGALGALGLTLLLGLTACSSARSSGTSRPGGPTSPTTHPRASFTTAGDPGYDVGHYDLRLGYSPAHPDITATARIDATATHVLRTIRLDLVGLSVDRATVDGRPATVRRAHGVLHVRPAHPLPAGRAFRIEVRYHGVPRALPDPTEPTSAARGSIGWNRTRDGNVYVVSEPDGARSWFPCDDRPADKATFSIRVDVPDRVTAAANGHLVPTGVHAGRRTWHWEMGHPMATYLATVVVAPMRETTAASPAGVPLRSFVPDSLTRRTVRGFAPTGAMVDYFASVFGPYPFSEYGEVTVDRDLGYALETQTLALFARDMLGTDADAELVVAHELAHQWFGDSVGIRQWSDIWLNEGFAEYSQYLWMAHAHADFDLDATMADLRASDADRLGPILHPGARATFSTSVYERGALTLHALRHTVGDDTFFRILSTWTDDHRYSTATTAEFVALAEQVSGRSLTTFFHAWLERPTVPPLPR